MKMLRLLASFLVGILGLSLIASFYPDLSQKAFLTSISMVVNCRAVNHSMGETCVPVHPQRIVTLSLATLGNVLALGIQPVGATNEYEQENYSTSFQGQAEVVKIIGRSQPNLESTLLLKPDLIIGLDWNSAVYPLLSQIAPTVMGELHYSEWSKYFHFVAEALGAQQAEQVAWEHYYRRIEELKTKLGDRYQNSTVSFICFYAGGISTAAPNSFAGGILRDAGLQRPASQAAEVDFGYLDFSLEEIGKADGDVIFVGIFAAGGNRVFEQVQKNPLWNSLKGVQAGKVYYVDVASWLATHMMATDAVIDDLFKYLADTP